MKSIGRTLEEKGGWFAFVLVFIISLFISPSNYKYLELIEGFPAIGLGVFGFMLTFVAIILQSDNETIAYMKGKQSLFALFVDYNKRVVITAALLTVYTYILPSLSYPSILVECTFDLKEIVLRICLSIYWATLIKLAVDMYYFIRSFYILLKK